MLTDEQRIALLPKVMQKGKEPVTQVWLTQGDALSYSVSIESAACADRDARIAEQDETLRFVERWANHHATKPNMTPEEALSCIQHYPAIRAITHGYADGQMPETPNPWKQLRELQSYVAELEQRNSDLHEDVKRFRNHALNEKDARMALERELAEARNQALEEAAVCCDEESLQAVAAWKLAYHPEAQGREIGADNCAAAIRAMKKEHP